MDTHQFCLIDVRRLVEWFNYYCAVVHRIMRAKPGRKRGPLCYRSIGVYMHKVFVISEKRGIEEKIPSVQGSNVSEAKAALEALDIASKQHQKKVKIYALSMLLK